MRGGVVQGSSWATAWFPRINQVIKQRSEMILTQISRPPPGRGGSLGQSAGGGGGVG